MARITSSQKDLIIKIINYRLLDQVSSNLDLDSIKFKVKLDSLRSSFYPRSYVCYLNTSVRNTFKNKTLPDSYSQSLAQFYRNPSFINGILTKTLTLDKDVIKMFYYLLFTQILSAYRNIKDIRNKKEILDFQKVELEDIYTTVRDTLIVQEEPRFLDCNLSLKHVLYTLIERNITLEDYYKEAKHYV